MKVKISIIVENSIIKNIPFNIKLYVTPLKVKEITSFDVNKSYLNINCTRTIKTISNINVYAITRRNLL